MRFIMNVSLPVERFNELAKEGIAGQKIGNILEEIKPEAAYFTSMNGVRGGYLVVDLKSPSDMVKYAEPWFLTFGATVDFHAAMTPQDLQSAGLEAIGKKWA